MSDTETRKSMDDVLASIRRIVRAEREANEAGTDDAEIVAGSVSGETGDAPLALTPEMMSETDEDGSSPDPFEEAVADDGGGIDTPTTPRAADLASFVSAPDPIDADLDAPPASKGLALDENALRDLVRDVIREEIANGEADGLIRDVLREELQSGKAEGMVRDIIRAELTTGEIGSNISRNVLRLIRSEVAKARD